VLGPVKAKPRGGADAASLDRACARGASEQKKDLKPFGDFYKWLLAVS
jgi:hypothetical protein